GVDGAGQPVPIPFELVDGRIVLRPVPAGAGKLDVTVRHPFFLPGGEARGSFSWTLARGKIVPAPLAVAASGGEIVARGGGAARLTTARGESRIERAARGAVSFPALEPG